LASSRADVLLELPADLLIESLERMLLQATRDCTLTCIRAGSCSSPIAAFVVTIGWSPERRSPFYSSYGSDKYVYEYEGIPSLWSNPQGLDRNLDSPLWITFSPLTIGHQACLTARAIWLLTLLGWSRWRRLAGNVGSARWLGGRRGLAPAVGRSGFYLTRHARTTTTAVTASHCGGCCGSLRCG